MTRPVRGDFGDFQSPEGGTILRYRQWGSRRRCKLALTREDVDPEFNRRK